MENIAVIVPGLMGSSLIRHGQPLWTDDLWANYQLLTSNPSLLNWHHARPADNTKLIEAFRLPIVGNNYNEYCIYRELVRSLRQHHNYGVGDRILCFPYDWRQSIMETAIQLGRTINSRYGIASDREGRQKPDSSRRFHIIGHSLGALIARIAIYNHYIHPQNVAILIQVGPPLEGSPCAFKALFGETGSQLLPYLSIFSLLRYSFRWKNLTPLYQILAKTLRTMPAVYELLPPNTNYVWIKNKGRTMVNPLNDTVIDPNTRASVIALHNRLRDSINMIMNEGINVVTVYCGFYYRKKTDISYVAENIGPSSGPYTYKFDRRYSSTHYGDGTVLETSATFSGRDSATSQSVMNAEHREMCCNPNVVKHIINLI